MAVRCGCLHMRAHAATLISAWYSSPPRVRDYEQLVLKMGDIKKTRLFQNAKQCALVVASNR